MKKAININLVSWVPNEKHPANKAMPESARKNASILGEAFKGKRKPTQQQGKIMEDITHALMEQHSKVTKDIFSDTALYKKNMREWFLGRAESLGDMDDMKYEIRQILDEL